MTSADVTVRRWSGRGLRLANREPRPSLSSATMENKDNFLENLRNSGEERRKKENAQLRAIIDNLQNVIAESREKLEKEDNPSLKHLVEKAEESLERLMANLRSQNIDPADEVDARR